MTVSYVTNVQADLVTGIFTEDGKSLLASGHALVEPTEQTSVQIELSDTPPQYFRVSAYLLDPETREPVCEAYDSQYYTKNIQDLMSKTAEDFEETDRLVYLDTGSAENQNLNFAVYNESIVVFNEDGTTDILTKNADGTWTFTNASAKAKSLKKGDIIAYNYKSGLMDACRVAKVTVKGNTVTVTTGDALYINDIFEQFRIHTDGDDGVKVKNVDTSCMSEYLTYKGLTDGDTEEVSVQSEDDVDAAGASSDVTLSEPVVKLDISGKNTTWTAKGNLYLEWGRIRVDYSSAFGNSYVQVNMDWSINYNFTFEGTTDGEWEWTMMELTFTPVAGCDIVVMPALCLEITGSISVSSKISGSIGVRHDGEWKNASEAPRMENKLKIEASFFIGMKFKVAVKILDEIEKLKSEFSFSVKAGGEFKVSNTIELPPDMDNKKHSCKDGQCLSIVINLKLSVTLQLDVLNDKMKTAITLATLTANQGTYFYSIDYSGLGEGTCPHYLYKTSFTASDKATKELVEGAEISLKQLNEHKECDGKATRNEDWTTQGLMKTDAKGEYSILLAPGEYEAVFDKGSLTATEKFTVEAESEEHEIVMDERVYSITYNIKDKKGIAQRGAEVTATDSKGNVTKVTADGSGKANLQLIGGAYDIEIHNGDLEKKFSTKVSRNLEMDVKLHGPAYKVTVSVTDENNNPVAGANIAGIDSEKENVLDDSAVTDENGKAEVYLEDGDYTIQAARTEGNLEGESSVVVNGEDQEVSITAYGKRTITVKVQDKSGNFLTNAGVVAVNGDKRYGGITDRNGKAEFVLGRGTWELTGTKGDLSGTGTVTVEGKDKSVILKLTETKYEVKIDFEVLGDKTYGGHTAELYSEDGESAGYWDEMGQWNLELKKGRYLLAFTEAWNYLVTGSGNYYVVTDEKIDNISIGTMRWIQVDGDTNVTVYGSPNTVSVSKSGDTLYLNGNGALDVLRKEDCTAEVKKVVVGSGIEYISSNVFKNTDCSNVEEIILPSTVKVISGAAFYDCISLKNMTVPSSVIYLGSGAIRGSDMENLNIYGRQFSFWDFAGKTKNLTIGTKYVSGSDFGDKAKNIIFTSEVETINASFRESDIEIVDMSSSNITELADVTFRACSKLQKVKLPSGITSIPIYMFSDCVDLTEVELPENLFVIKQYAFYNCSSLKSIKIPQGVKTIEHGCFEKCTSLETVDMTEATVEKIESLAFYETALKKFTIPETVTTMESGCLLYVALEELTVLGYDGFNMKNLNATAKKIILNVPTVVKAGNSACETIIIGEKVKRIEDNAFEGAAPLKEIVWPEHLEYLGSIDFSEFTELEEINMPDKIDSGSVGISKMPASLKRAKFPEGKEIVYWEAFRKCTNLTEVQLPASIETIWYDAFNGCENLESVTFNEGSHLKSIGARAFKDCTALKKIALGNEVEKIEEDAFMGCTSLTEAVVPSGKTFYNGRYLEEFSTSRTFDECPNLASLTLGSENVNMSANSTMTGLKKITLLDTVKEISKGTCPNVEEIVIPASVKTIAWNAFEKWTGLRKVTILGEKVRLTEKMFAGCTSLEEVNIEGEVTSVGNSAFSGCKNLKKIDQSKLLKNMWEIPDSLFYGCRSLTEAEIPDHIEIIGIAAYGCTGLTEVDIPRSVNEIKYGAFKGCRNLKSVFVPAEVESIWEDTFDNRWIENICFEDIYSTKYLGQDILSVMYETSNEEIDLRYRYNRPDNYLDLLDQVHAKMKSITIFYPAGANITDYYKEYLGLDYCTWIPYTGSLDDPEAFMASEELQAAVGADGFSDGLSEAETGTAEPEVTEEQAEPEEVIISDEEESAEESSGSESSDTDDNSEISVEEEFGDGEELIINEIEKPVFEAAENFTSGSAVLELNAAGEAVSGVIQKQTYTGLVENSNCFFAVVRDKETVDFFAPSNLLFMTQAVSDDDGNLTIEYCTADNTGIPVLYGAEKSLDLSNAEITVEEGLAYTGQEQKTAVTVVCSGKTLTEGKDYVLRGNTAVTDAGTYTIKIVGRNSYKGSVEREYQVAKVKQKISTGMMARELTTGSRVSLRAAGIGTISYTSRQPDVASVDAGGVITAKKAGVASIVIQASGDKNHISARKNVIVFVKAGTGNAGNNGNNGNGGSQNTGGSSGSGSAAQKPAVKKSVMKLNASSLVLRKKQKTSALTVSGMVSGDYVKAVTSGNKKLVKVVRFTKNGKITLQAQKKTGKTTLTIQLANGAKKTIKVKVQAGKVKTTKISITKKVRIKKGKKLKLKPALTPITSQEKITFTSSNKKVVTVTSKGVIKAKKPGKAKITVKSGKKKVTVTVTVTK